MTRAFADFFENIVETSNVADNEESAPHVETPIDGTAEEWRMRVDLAAAYRLAVIYG